MRVVFFSLLILLAIQPPPGLVNFLSHFYELCYRVYHYDYAHITDPEYAKELTFSEKVLCQQGYYTDEMKELLHGDMRGEEGNHKGKTVEQVVVNGRSFIVKTHVYKGFWQNLFVRGRGVTIWNNAHRMQERGIPVLKPVALVEKRGRTESTSTVVYLMEGELGREGVDYLIPVEKLVEKMMHLRVLMRDFCLENIVFLEGKVPQLIDIGRIFEYPKFSPIFKKAFFGQLQRFNQGRNLIHEHTLFLWELLMRELSHLYQRCWPIFHYEYAKIHDDDYIKQWSFREKLFCHKDSFTPAMQTFLRGEDKQPRGLMSVHEGHITEKIELNGKGYIVKTTEERGFLNNLLQMSVGVKVWNNGHLAKERGLPALIPVALKETRTLTSSKSIVVYPMEGSILKDAMERGGDLHLAVTKIIQKMVDTHAIHAEFRPLNAIYLENGEVRLIDIDGLHFYPNYSYLFKKRLDIELDRFNKKAKLSGLLHFEKVILPDFSWTRYNRSGHNQGTSGE